MGLYKLCDHTGRQRDRCAHAWWGSCRGRRVSLSRWTGRQIRTKVEALTALEALRAAVRSGTFERPARARSSPIAAGPMTFGELAQEYKQRHVQARRLALEQSIDYRLKPLLERFASMPIATIRLAHVEDFIADLKQPRVVNRRPDRTLAPASINRTIELMRHMLNWAVAREYLDRTPFRRGSENLVRPEIEDNTRRRRVTEQEEADLLAAAPPYLRTLIIGALDTGMRRGEMLALRWADVDLGTGLITLRGATTKSRRTRQVPIATQRLRSVLEWLRIDAAGETKPEDTPVFSNEAGEPIGSFRTAWVLTVLKAHGVDTRWRKGTYRELAPACTDAFRRIDLHWHDLRHEYASRLVERGVPLAQVRDLLGHASITTTERYDNQTLESLQAAARKLETGKSFEPDAGIGPSGRPRTRASRADKVSSFFQDQAKVPASRQPDPAAEEDANACSEKDLPSWLGGRDSNPDTVVQSHVSYR